MTEESSCRNVRGVLWEYTAGALAESDRRGIAAHLSACRACDAERGEIRSLRTGIKQLPIPPAPAVLGTKAARHCVARAFAAVIAQRLCNVVS